jgi:uncharacterized membrane protein
MAVGLLAAAAVVAAVSGHAGDPGPANLRLAANVITFKVCNKTKDATVVGVSYIPIGGTDWRNKGWTTVGANSCRDIFTTANRTFYARAEVKGKSDQYWGKDIKQCVEYPGPYDFMTKSEDTTCPEGEPADMTTFHSDGTPSYVWNLNP